VGPDAHSLHCFRIGRDADALQSVQPGRNTGLGSLLRAFFNNIFYLASLVYLIVLLCGASTKGENRYGPEPAA
jgi:hypothetical protein